MPPTPPDAAPTPAGVLAALASREEAQPALIHHDDTPGPTQGERIELSRRVLRTWVAKTANLLQEGLDVTPGSVVRLDLPTPHWRLVYWAYAVWSVGATLTVDDDEGADVLVTADPASELAGDADAVVVVTLPALARGAQTELAGGVIDEAKEIASYADDFHAWDEPEPDDVALVCRGVRTTYAELPSLAGGPRPDAQRVLLLDAGTRAEDLLAESLRTFAGGGSIVLLRTPDPVDPQDPRWAAEGVTSTA